MARKAKAPKPLDRAQEKARKQKRLAAILGVALVGVLVFEVPHTMKLMNSKAKAPVVEASSTPPAATPTVTTAVVPASSPPSSSPSSTPSGSPFSSSSSALSGNGLVSSVQVTPDEGQLTQFERFASKDPFLPTIQKTPSATDASGSGGATAGGGGTKTSTTPSKPKAPPAPPPTSAVISLNGELMTVNVGAAFPASGVTFSRVGSLFQLDSLTAKSAKVSIVGGAYADGAGALTLDVGMPVTLQNTADGTRYTLILEPQGTQVPTTTTPSTGAPVTPTSTTPSVVPSSPSG